MSVAATDGQEGHAGLALGSRIASNGRERPGPCAKDVNGCR